MPSVFELSLLLSKGTWGIGEVRVSVDIFWSVIAVVGGVGRVGGVLAGHPRMNGDRHWGRGGHRCDGLTVGGACGWMGRVSVEVVGMGAMGPWTFPVVGTRTATWLSSGFKSIHARPVRGWRWSAPKVPLRVPVTVSLWRLRSSILRTGQMGGPVMLRWLLLSTVILQKMWKTMLVLCFYIRYILI